MNHNRMEQEEYTGGERTHFGGEGLVLLLDIFVLLLQACKLLCGDVFQFLLIRDEESRFTYICAQE